MATPPSGHAVNVAETGHRVGGACRLRRFGGAAFCLASDRALAPLPVWAAMGFHVEGFSILTRRPAGQSAARAIGVDFSRKKPTAMIATPPTGRPSWQLPSI